MQADAGAPVQLFRHEAVSGHVVAEARLNSETTLNALSLEMIDLLTEALAAWRSDPRVVAVVLSGAGDRAFSAGGDVQALYRAMIRNHEMGERVDDYPYDFFEREYRLDFMLHTFPKPVLAIGFGVIMGGGLGVFSAADFRVVSEKVRIAFPEVTIGLFPDAGGTWLLRNLPEHQALFLGLTGASINSRDALDAGIATHAVTREAQHEIVSSVCACTFEGAREHDAAAISAALARLPVPELPAAQLKDVPDSLTLDGSVQAVVERVSAARGASGWYDAALAAMERGCPTTVGIVVEQLKRAPHLALADCFRLEMTVATHCADNHDFAEGVRALLVDKDNAPNWQFGDVDALPEAYVLKHFEEPWSANPLADLNEEL